MKSKISKKREAMCRAGIVPASANPTSFVRAKNQPNRVQRRAASKDSKEI